MIRDIVRATLKVAVLAASAAIVVETCYQLAAIDLARRACSGAVPAQYMPAPPPAPPADVGRLRRFGRAALDLADAAIGVVR